MNAAQFKAALETVEQDHQMVLDKMQVLRDTISCLLEPEKANGTEILQRFREIRDYFATQFEAHMEEEDTTLFPLLESDGATGAELVARLREEHELIRKKRQELADCIHLASELEEHLPSQVLIDLYTYGWELWYLLDRHAHEETRAVQEQLTRFLRKVPQR